MNKKTIFKVKWSSPSNIALVKYWGKFGVQLPCNPSISFTLKNSFTTLSLEVLENGAPGFEFIFEGKSNQKFQEKIAKFLSTQTYRFSWLDSYYLKIESSNTFPHSSGIASSASSMSALCLAIMSADEFITNKKYSTEEFYQLSSQLSRLASGSASRSVYPGLASWGETEAIVNSTNEYASAYTSAHSLFTNYCDSIIIVDANEKSVSSRIGHSLMESHPFKQQRFAQGRANLTRLISALESGDLNTFIDVVEEEAMTLHALMMTSRPSYILLHPESLRIIAEIRAFREKERIPACFTIDAGPNIHLLYPKVHAKRVREFIAEKFNGLNCIHDEVGMGPVKF